MRSTIIGIGLAALTLAGAPAPARAQEPPPDTTDILRAILLPAITERLRERGVPTGEIEAVLMGARERGVPPAETSRVLDETVLAVEEHGPIDNFGAFVQERLRQGLRGQELAAAIRAEHQRRGIGRGNRIEARDGRPGQGGRPGEAGARTGGEPGPPAGGRGRGRPDTIRPDTSGLAAFRESGAPEGGAS